MAGKFVADYKAVGEKIRKQRLSLNLTQEAAAEKSGISVGFYSNIERGEKVPSVDSLIDIVNALNLDLNSIFINQESKGNKPKSQKNTLQAEFNKIFKGKTPAQSEYLLSVFKLLSENMDVLRP